MVGSRTDRARDEAAAAKGLTARTLIHHPD